MKPVLTVLLSLLLLLAVLMGLGTALFFGFGALLGPLLIGGFLAVHMGWRPAYAVDSVAAAVLIARSRRRLTVLDNLAVRQESTVKILIALLVGTQRRAV